MNGHFACNTSKRIGQVLCARLPSHACKEPAGMGVRA